MKRRFLLAGVFTTLVAVLTVRLVLAIPPQPHRTFGTVTLDGENVAEGTPVNAYCGQDPTPYGQTTAEIFLGESVYAVNVLGDDPETAGTKEGCLPGETIHFTIAYQGQEIAANETTTWSAGTSEELNLTGEKPNPEIAVRKLVNGQDVDVDPGLYVLAGETVTWTYTISNTGNVALSDVVLEDDNGTPGNPGDDYTCPIGSLAAGVEDSTSCQYSAVAAAGQYMNQATASAFYTQTISAVDTSYYYGALLSVDLEKTTNDQDADTAPGVYVAVGQPVTWTYTVDNTGNVALSDVAIVDDQLGAICTITNLAPDDPPATCLSLDTAVSGQYANVATVTAETPAGLPSVEDSDASHYFGVETNISLAKLTNDQDADTPPGPYLLSGSPVNWAYIVQNDSNVELSSVQVTDNLVVNIDCQGISALGPGEQMTCTATGTAIEGQYMNIGTVEGAPPGGLGVISTTNPSHYFGARPEIQIEKYTNDVDADDPPGVYIDVGETITWTYVVSNTGNVDLNGITIIDDNGTPGMPGDDFEVCPIPSMSPGDAPVSCTTNGTAEAGQYVNAATAEATPIGGLDPISDIDLSHYVGAAPSVAIEKSTNGQDADFPPGPYIPVIPTPADITWTYDITNDGTVTLTNFIVTDDHPSVNVQCPVVDELGPMKTFSCEATGTAEEGQYANLATVEATPIGGLDVVTDTDASHYFGARPLITVEKSTNGEDADTGTGPFLIVGSNVTWTYTIVNSGNVTVTVDSLVDDQGVLPDCPLPVQLGPAEQIVCEAYGEAGIGQYANLATVEATPIGGLSLITDTDPSHYYGANPLIAVQKYTNGQDADTETGPYIPVGDPVLWTYVVTNTGNVSLSNVLLVDDNGTPGNTADDYICPIGTLAAGVEDSTTCQQSLAGGAVAGQQSNLATVSGDFATVTAEASDASHYFGALTGINLEKHTNGEDADSAPGPFILVGDQVTWTYMITNTGNVPLTGVTITDDRGTPGNTADDFSCNFAELLPGIPRSCMDEAVANTGQFTNEASVVGTPPGGLPDVQDADLSHYFGAMPTIKLEKFTNDLDVVSPPGPYILSGDPVTWTYVISNTGNVTLTVTSVSDDQGVTVECPGQTILAPDESITCQATDTAVDGQYSNVGAVIATPPGGLNDVSDDDTSFYFGATPGIALKKLTNDQDADIGPGPYILTGETVTWTFIITNTGNVTLTDIIVTDDNGTPDLVDDDIVSDDQGPLPAQASTTYMLTGIAQEGPYTNVGSVSAKPLIGDDVSAMSASSYFGATVDLSIKKFTNGEDAPVAPGPIVEAGEPVTWTYVISTTGNVTLSDVIVEDDNGTPDEPGDDVEICQLAQLEPGQPDATCTWVGTAIPGQYVNRATVTGLLPGSLEPIVSEDLSHYLGYVPAPAIRIEKLVNGQIADSEPGPYVRSGQQVTWTYNVFNIGNVPLTDIQVIDDNGTPAESADDFEVCTLPLLESLESGNCQLTGSALEGAYVNVARVSATFEGGAEDVTDQDAAHYFGVTIDLTIEKLTNGVDADDPPGVTLKPGTTVTWTYMVSSSSNVLLTDVAVWDDNGTAANPGDDFVVCTVGDLLPGEQATCHHQGIAAAGPYGNVGTVVANSPLQVEELSSDRSHYISFIWLYLPAIIVD